MAMKGRRNELVCTLCFLWGIVAVGADVSGLRDENEDATRQSERYTFQDDGTSLRQGGSMRQLQASTTCPARPAIGQGQEPWDKLSSTEKSYVTNTVQNELSISLYYSDDKIGSVELEEPPKFETLQYLDWGGPMPNRYARVSVYYGSSFSNHGCSEPCVMEYRVGPIPFPEFSSSSELTLTVLTEPDEISWRVSGITTTQKRAMDGAVNSFVRHDFVSDFLRAAFGNAGTIEWHTHDNEMLPTSPRSIRISWKRKDILLSYNLSHPLPLECKVDVEDTARVHSIIYRAQFFPTQEDFIEALRDNKVEIVKTLPFEPDPAWQRLDRRESSRPNNDDPPATNVEPSVRYTIQGGRVKWLGWSFHVTDRPRTSMALHDVSFKGERIAYEISLQELQAIYTGKTPHMANKFLFDSIFNYGSGNRPLKPGVDCPDDATYFDNLCIFENDKSIPLWRKDGYSWYAGARHTQLIVRSTFPVGNYDYMVEAKFDLDGQIEVGFAAMGEMFLSYYTSSSDEPFGTRIHDEALANLHAHFAGLKVDLDILGTENCVSKSQVKYGNRRESVPGAADEPEWDVPETTMYIHHEIITDEDDARVVIDNRKPTTWRVVSCNEANQWGSDSNPGYLRGYEIKHPNTPLAIYEDRAPGFSEHHMVFAQRKETEPYLTTPYDYLTRADPYVPITGENGISNGENLEGEDIVAWVSLGFFHHPRAEDSPVTNTVPAHVLIRPFNYFDENPALDLGQTEYTRGSTRLNTIPKGDCTVEV